MKAGAFPPSLDMVLSKLVGNKPPTNRASFRQHAVVLAQSDGAKLRERQQSFRKRLDIDALNVVNLAVKALVAPRAQKRDPASDETRVKGVRETEVGADECRRQAPMPDIQDEEVAASSVWPESPASQCPRQRAPPCSDEYLWHVSNQTLSSALLFSDCLRTLLRPRWKSSMQTPRLPDPFVGLGLWFSAF